MRVCFLGFYNMMKIALGFGDNFHGLLMLENEWENVMKVSHLLTVMA